MTLKKFISLQCDASLCEEYLDSPWTVAREARDWAWRYKGWAHRDGKDFCPFHARKQ